MKNERADHGIPMFCMYLGSAIVYIAQSIYNTTWSYNESELLGVNTNYLEALQPDECFILTAQPIVTWVIDMSVGICHRVVISRQPNGSTDVFQPRHRLRYTFYLLLSRFSAS